MNKRGWMRIVEASIAIMIILGVLFALYSKTLVSSEPDLSQRARDILEEIALNATLRMAVLQNNNLEVNNSIIALIPEPALAFEFRICTLDSACGQSSFVSGNVYAAERVISTDLTNSGELGPRKIRLFIWRKAV